VPSTLYQNTTVAFVGDGKNDTVALATADVGIHFGKQRDSLQNTPGDAFVITSSQLSHVQLLIQLSKLMMFTIKLNLFWALSYNIVAIPISTGLFYPHLSLNPQFASLWMTLSSLLVVASSTLFLHYFKRNSRRTLQTRSLG
jgi:Cu2+-exporting ATPase